MLISASSSVCSRTHRSLKAIRRNSKRRCAMNGARFLLDTNFIIGLLKGNPAIADLSGSAAWYWPSVLIAASPAWNCLAIPA